MSNNDNGRGVGRPKDIGARGGQCYTGKCDVRLTAEENNMLTNLANRNNVARSEIVRKALHDFFRFNSDDDD